MKLTTECIPTHKLTKKTKQFILKHNQTFDWSPQVTQSDFSLDYAFYFVLLADERIIGYIGFHQLFEAVTVNTVFIKENERGQRFGRRMLAYFVRSLPENVESVTLEVRSHNKAARHLYETLGFETIDQRAHYYRNPLDDAVVMQLHLSKQEETQESSDKQ